jgi:phage terminase large subunit
MSKLTLEIPEKIGDALFQPKRYKVLYGGRGGAKSWSIARVLLVMGYQKKLRILCAREIQKSIKDSVHQLLSDQIEELGLGGFYDVLATEIRGANGTQIAFTGLRHNTKEIKSHEGADVCWVEEADKCSPSSWKILTPTIRKENSEIWISYNPDLEDDETHQRFVINPPKESVVTKVNWSDNPWFPSVLKMEMEELKERNYDEYLHVWEGHCREVLEGSIYADELRMAKVEERITSVPVDQSKPVDVFWDLGWADCTSMWFVQTVGKEIRVINFYQNQLKKLQHYVGLLQNKGYCYNKQYLPHDAYNGQLSGKNVDKSLRDLGFKTERVAKLDVQQGIQCARTVFSSCWFDASRCADGLSALRKYRYEVDPDTHKFSKTPLHDENSHAADAWRYFAVAYRPPVKKVPTGSRQSGGWMGL